MTDLVLDQIIVSLADASRDLPPSCATDDVRARLVELIRHLEAESLIPPDNWDVSAREHR
jgi:hypothetical protein